MANIHEELRPTSSELVILDPKKVKLIQGPGDAIRMEIQDWDRSYLRVRVRRAFPISNPDHYIGFNDGDDKDIGMVVNPRELDKESQHLIAGALVRRYFIPTIFKIFSLKDEFGLTYWIVDTDKGRREFITRGRRESLHELPGTTRVLITDVDSNRYDIPDVDALDKRSFALLSRVLY